MLHLYNSLGKHLQPFQPVTPGCVTIFTCGPSIYQRAHIGNFRTFLFEDILVRYLRFSGYQVQRGMNFTDIEDKAVTEAQKARLSVGKLTTRNIQGFLKEMKLLGMLKPDYLPRASRAIPETVRLIEALMDKGAAYRHDCDIYFDPLTFPGFGQLYGLDMSRWPKTRRRYGKDTYPGMRWNLGDFILWHGCTEHEETHWKTRLGIGRPAWNVQDAVLVSRHFEETLSIYCGGIDNLVRHHDYSRAILESVRPYPMARYWLHCEHLVVRGQKMSKSKGNVLYTDNLMARGFRPAEIRFFLIDNHYRQRLNYSEKTMRYAAERLTALKAFVQTLGRIARSGKRLEASGFSGGARLRKAFTRKMDQDLNVKAACDALLEGLSEAVSRNLKPAEAACLLAALSEIDGVLGVLFSR